MKHLHLLNDHEIPVCLLLNRINRWKPVSVFFAGISRLGDGVFWYTLMLALPIIYGLEAVQASSHMGIIALVGLAIYKWMKTSTLRVRPYRHNKTIIQNVAALDQFSFPSGHTLHAVSFATLIVHYYPAWGLLVIPFAGLVALSRVVLGLHYPSDVVMGAMLGFGLAISSIELLSLI